MTHGPYFQNRTTFGLAGSVVMKRSTIIRKCSGSQGAAICTSGHGDCETTDTNDGIVDKLPVHGYSSEQHCRRLAVQTYRGFGLSSWPGSRVHANASQGIHLHQHTLMVFDYLRWSSIPVGGSCKCCSDGLSSRGCHTNWGLENGYHPRCLWSIHVISGAALRRGRSITQLNKSNSSNPYL